MKKETVGGASLLLVAAVLMLASGCGFVYVDTNVYVGTPQYPATDPASVEILRTEPKRPNDRLGEIAAQPAGDASVADIEQKLRREAAKIGANAAVIVSDRIGIMGPVVKGSWYSGRAMPELHRVVVAVAIRYRDHQ